MTAPDARTLATHLATLDDASLVALWTTRRVSPTVGWSDFFDAADALLDPSSVARGAAALSRAEADALDDAVTDGESVRDEAASALLTRAALVAPDGRPYAAVVAAWPTLPRAAAPDAAAPESGRAEDPAHAAERAFAASSSLADVLHAALGTPLARIGSGALGASERRRLIEAGAVDDADAADELVAIAAHAGLLAEVERVWMVTGAGDRWLSARTVTRWHEVARRLRAALPQALRTVDGGWIPVAEWPTAHPFDPAWPERAARLRRLMERWALIGPDGSPAPWAIGLSEGADGDEDALQTHLPTEVDRVFLQNDLTAIAPGPLDPPLDRRLRSMSLRESRAQASSYRFTAETLTAALTAGETAETLREFLTGLSLTGLPQPLAYEIGRSAQRHGAVRVGPDWSGRTRISADDPAMLQTIGIDQTLRPLGLVADGEHLLSRTDVESTFWLLADSRYPVAAVDADGKVRALDRHRIAAEADDAPEAPYDALLRRLRTAHDTDADGAWLGRELEQAVRAHTVLRIVVRLPGGGEREVVLEATGLGGGRLRGLDRAADVERTLPVSSIASVRPA